MHARCVSLQRLTNAFIRLHVELFLLIAQHTMLAHHALVYREGAN